MPAVPPEGFRHLIPMTIRYGDMDTLGHVNNAKYLTYIEMARISYFRDLQMWDGAQNQTGAIVARITMDYKLPLTIADGTVEVWTRCSRLGTKSFDLENLIITRRGGDEGLVAAQSVTVMVSFDYQNDATIAVPQAWRDLMTAYEGTIG